MSVQPSNLFDRFNELANDFEKVPENSREKDVYLHTLGSKDHMRLAVSYQGGNIGQRVINWISRFVMRKSYVLQSDSSTVKLLQEIHNCNRETLLEAAKASPTFNSLNESEQTAALAKIEKACAGINKILQSIEDKKATSHSERAQTIHELFASIKLPPIKGTIQAAQADVTNVANLPAPSPDAPPPPSFQEQYTPAQKQRDAAALQYKSAQEAHSKTTADLYQELVKKLKESNQPLLGDLKQIWNNGIFFPGTYAENMRQKHTTFEEFIDSVSHPKNSLNALRHLLEASGNKAHEFYHVLENADQEVMDSETKMYQAGSKLVDAEVQVVSTAYKAAAASHSLSEERTQLLQEFDEAKKNLDDAVLSQERVLKAKHEATVGMHEKYQGLMTRAKSDPQFFQSLKAAWDKVDFRPRNRPPTEKEAQYVPVRYARENHGTFEEFMTADFLKMGPYERKTHILALHILLKDPGIPKEELHNAFINLAEEYKKTAPTQEQLVEVEDEYEAAVTKLGDSAYELLGEAVVNDPIVQQYLNDTLVKLANIENSEEREKSFAQFTSLIEKAYAQSTSGQIPEVIQSLLNIYKNVSCKYALTGRLV